MFCPCGLLEGRFEVVCVFAGGVLWATFWGCAQLRAMSSKECLEFSLYPQTYSSKFASPPQTSITTIVTTMDTSTVGGCHSNKEKGAVTSMIVRLFSFAINPIWDKHGQQERFSFTLYIFH